MNRVILPGATIGVLGSGQLGRMFALSARRLGYRVHTYSPDYDTPTGQVADREVQAPYEDLDAVAKFASEVDVVTFEFENIPLSTANAAANCVAVRPSGAVLHTAQNRIREKGTLTKAGIAVTPYWEIRSLDQLRASLAKANGSAVLKTAGWGYDGKGQVRIDQPDQAATAWDAVDTQEAVLEQWVDFQQEVSVVAARGLDGQMANYGVIHNEHRNHILDVSVAPANVPEHVQRKAVEIAYAVLELLDVVGVLCVEFFVTADERLLVNEISPRPHNSGHLTWDACITGQFEQQLRAICGLPLGSTEYVRAAAMANLLGDHWQQGTPDWAAVCNLPGVHLHLYGKQDARPGRKMGHITALATTASEASRVVRQAREALGSVDPVGHAPRA